MLPEHSISLQSTSRGLHKCKVIVKRYRQCRRLPKMAGGCCSGTWDGAPASPDGICNGRPSSSVTLHPPPLTCTSSRRQTFCSLSFSIVHRGVNNGFWRRAASVESILVSASFRISGQPGRGQGCAVQHAQSITRARRSSRHYRQPSACTADNCSLARCATCTPTFAYHFVFSPILPPSFPRLCSIYPQAPWCCAQRQ